MVRAGEGGYLADEFEQKGYVAVGFEPIQRSFREFHTRQELHEYLAQVAPELKPGAIVVGTAVAWKFAHSVKPGDRVVSYDPRTREYLVGTIAGDYEYHPGIITDYAHIRSARWDGRVSRDALATASRNSLGSAVTLFEPGPEVLADLEAGLKGKASALALPAATEPAEDLEDLRAAEFERAHEFLKDRIVQLSPDDMEQLVAAVLRALGYKARVTPKGPDRGRDVEASPDGLGLQSPRVVAEVKHRRDPMGAPEIRSFLGGLREGDRGLFVSTGGFTREAKYEANRAPIPIRLVDLEDLAKLVEDNYEAFDREGHALLPLRRIYWPAS